MSKKLFISVIDEEYYNPDPILKFRELQKDESITLAEFSEYISDDNIVAAYYDGVNIVARLDGFVATESKEYAQILGITTNAVEVPDQYITELDDNHQCEGWDYLVSKLFLLNRSE